MIFRNLSCPRPHRLDPRARAQPNGRNQNQRQRRSDKDQNIDIAHRKHDGPDDSIPDAIRDRVQIAPVHSGDDLRNAVRSRLRDHREHIADGGVQEDSVGNGHRDRRAGQLRVRDKAHRHRDPRRVVNAGLRGGERKLQVGPGTGAEENGKPVNFAGGGIFVHGVHQNAADEGENATKDEHRGGQVMELGRQEADQQLKEDQEHDEGEQSDAGLESTVPADELEVQGQERDGDESDSRRASHDHKNAHQAQIPQEFEGDGSPGPSGPDAKVLLQPVNSDKNARDEEKRNRPCTVPGILHAAEGDGHQAGHIDPGHQDQSHPVQLTNPRHSTSPGPWIFRRNHEDRDRREQRSNHQIDVKRKPPPGAALFKGTANDRTEHGCDTPCQPGDSEVQRAFLFQSRDGKEGHDAGIHARSPRSTDGAPDDHGVHVRGRAADGRTDFEQKDACDVQPFGVELRVRLAPEEK